MPKPSRRDFLKLASALSGAWAFSNLAPKLAFPKSAGDMARPNIIILVFDAMAAKNLSVYGYKRRTTPNLERFAEHAVVYNAHQTPGSFTTPGTASLLTGLYPWTHRAINEGGLIARNLADRNFFRLIGESYHRLAFSQNLWPNYFFGQFHPSIDEILSPASFSLVDQIVGDKFGGDPVGAYRAFDDFLFQDGTPPASLVFGLAERVLLRRAVARAPSDDYPRGIPRTGNYPIFFRLRDVFDGIMTTLERLSSPYVAYLHFWSPHAPYRPTKSFDSLFSDGWRPPEKPEHELGDQIPPRKVNDRRQNYDEYIADLDNEFGRLLEFLESKKVFETSYVIITSDHGEFFERGVEGHITPLLYEPVTHIPLLVSFPGQKSRQDVYSPTTSLDLLPTLVHLTGGTVPDWCEGELLPLLGGEEKPDRSIFMMDAKTNPAFAAWPVASFAIRRGRFKLICYRGHLEYDRQDKFELYDMESDPEELNDLYSGSSSVAKPLRDELFSRIESANSKYER